MDRQLVYPDPPLRVGERVRLLRDREFAGGATLPANSEHFVAMIEPHHFPPRGRSTLDPSRDYGVMLHKNGCSKGKLVAHYPVSPFDLERVEPSPGEARKLCDYAEIAALAILRARRAARQEPLPFWLSPVLPRPYPCPKIEKPSMFVERAGELISCQTLSERGAIKGFVEHDGAQWVLTAGWSQWHQWQSVTAYRVIPADCTWASKIVKSDAPRHDVGYHGDRAKYRGKEYVIVGPEIEFVPASGEGKPNA
jgi:hypothetical protein